VAAFGGLGAFGRQQPPQRRRGIELCQRRAQRLKARARGNVSSSMARRIAAVIAACSSSVRSMVGMASGILHQ
jgi:hypothetical protein